MHLRQGTVVGMAQNFETWPKSLWMDKSSFAPLGDSSQSQGHRVSIPTGFCPSTGLQFVLVNNLLASLRLAPTTSTCLCRRGSLEPDCKAARRAAGDKSIDALV